MSILKNFDSNILGQKHSKKSISFEFQNHDDFVHKKDILLEKSNSKICYSKS